MNELYKKVKCPDCCWWYFQDGETVAMNSCPECNSTGYIFESVEESKDE